MGFQEVSVYELRSRTMVSRSGRRPDQAVAVGVAPGGKHLLVSSGVDHDPAVGKFNLENAVDPARRFVIGVLDELG